MHDCSIHSDHDAAISLHCDPVCAVRCCSAAEALICSAEHEAGYDEWWSRSGPFVDRDWEGLHKKNLSIIFFPHELLVFSTLQDILLKTCF